MGLHRLLVVGDTRTVADRMADAALTLIGQLDDEHRHALCLPFEADERTRWSYYPRETAGSRHVGLPLFDLSMQQRKRVMQLVRAGTSRHAFAQVNMIMALETVLDSIEDHVLTEYRDPARYWLTIFGQPGPSGAWGWRFEGHHVSVHHTLLDGAVIASTPLFLGAHPARVRHGSAPVVRTCAEEEDAARELMGSLDEGQYARALLHKIPPIDIVLADTPEIPPRALPGDPVHPLDEMQAEIDAMKGGHREDLALDLTRPSGVAGVHLSKGQRKLLADVIAVYVERLPAPLAAVESAAIEANGLETIHFGWAGSTSRRRPHYYRLHGPSFIVEYDCVQDQANHIHSVWRNPHRDFGRDPLGQHLRSDHR